MRGTHEEVHYMVTQKKWNGKKQKKESPQRREKNKILIKIAGNGSSMKNVGKRAKFACAYKRERYTGKIRQPCAKDQRRHF